MKKLLVFALLMFSIPLLAQVRVTEKAHQPGVHSCTPATVCVDPAHVYDEARFDADGLAIYDVDKPAQLFRFVNLTRIKNDMPELKYRAEDQAVANWRAKSIASEFRADTLSSRGEVIYSGTYEQVIGKIINTETRHNYQYRADVGEISVGLYKQRRTYFAVVRIF